MKRYLILPVCFVLMPRKKFKTEKQPLQFLERPAGEARVHYNGPEVRTALNPKDFFTETQRQNRSTLHSWVSPQFDSSASAQIKRKRGQLATNIHHVNLTQLSRKNSSCNKFPSLLFKTKSKDCHQVQRREVLHNGISSTSSGQGFSQKTNTTYLNAQKLRTAESIVHQNDEVISHNGNSKTAESLCSTRGRSCLSSETPSSNASKDCAPAEITSPNIVTPSRNSSSTSSKPLCLLWSPPNTPPSKCNSDILVPDTPERDYGIKVTWRRRRNVMLLLKAKGHLSDSEAVIHV